MWCVLLFHCRVAWLANDWGWQHSALIRLWQNPSERERGLCKGLPKKLRIRLMDFLCSKLPLPGIWYRKKVLTRFLSLLLPKVILLQKSAKKKSHLDVMADRFFWRKELRLLCKNRQPLQPYCETFAQEKKSREFPLWQSKKGQIKGILFSLLKCLIS